MLILPFYLFLDDLLLIFLIITEIIHPNAHVTIIAIEYKIKNNAPILSQFDVVMNKTAITIIVTTDKAMGINLNGILLAFKQRSICNIKSIARKAKYTIAGLTSIVLSIGYLHFFC